MKALFATRNPQVRDLARALGRVAATDLPVLLEGETGTGKSHLARRIHDASRPGRPFAVVDCAALPESLVPAELFGHVSGAFTDATRGREGWLARAGDGTLVLDRLDVLHAEGQTALLRVLEERRFVPVGAHRQRTFHARVVALAMPGAAPGAGGPGALRADLYHRVAGYHAVLPPLRRRPEDILPFAATVLRRLSRARGGASRLDDDATQLLLAYPWPGNFRELEAVLERANLMEDGEEIGVAALHLTGAAWSSVAAAAAERERPLADVQRLYALWVLSREAGNVSRAARVLGVSRRTLIRWRGEPPA